MTASYHCLPQFILILSLHPTFSLPSIEAYIFGFTKSFIVVIKYLKYLGTLQAAFLILQLVRCSPFALRVKSLITTFYGEHRYAMCAVLTTKCFCSTSSRLYGLYYINNTAHYGMASSGRISSSTTQMIQGLLIKIYVKPPHTSYLQNKISHRLDGL